MTFTTETESRLKAIDHEMMMSFEELELALGLIQRNRKAWQGYVDIFSAIKSLEWVIEELKKGKPC